VETLNKPKLSLISLFIIIIFISCFYRVDAEIIHNHSTNINMRYTEIIDISENGNANIWAIIRFKLPENHSENPYFLDFKIDSHVNNSTIEIYPDVSNETFGNYLQYKIEEYDEDEKFVHITLNASVSEKYQYYSFLFHYIIPPPYLAEKISKSFEEGDRWIINHQVYVPNDLNHYVRLAIILPKRADIQNPKLFIQYEGMPKGIESVLELDYQKWGNISKKEYYPLPFNSSLFENKLVLYNNNAPNSVTIFERYTLPNESSLFFGRIIPLLGLVISAVALFIGIIKNKDKFIIKWHSPISVTIPGLIALFLLTWVIVDLLPNILKVLTLLLALAAIVLSLQTTSLVNIFRNEQRERDNVLMRELSDIKASETATDMRQEEKEIVINKTEINDLKSRYFELIRSLSKEIDKWGQYPSSMSLGKQHKGRTIDFVLDTEDGPIPIEVKVYPKRIINNNLPHKLRSTMRMLANLLNANTALLVVLNPGITSEAKEIIQKPDDDIRIDILQDEKIEKLVIKFRRYLNHLKPRKY